MTADYTLQNAVRSIGDQDELSLLLKWTILGVLPSYKPLLWEKSLLFFQILSLLFSLCLQLNFVRSAKKFDDGFYLVISK